jgi:hypothetical protein
LAVGLAPVAGDLGEHLVWSNASRSRQSGFLQDLPSDFLGDVPCVTPLSGGGDVKVGFIKGEGLHQWGVVMKDLADLLGGCTVEIEPKGQEDQVRTALPRHESRHRRADPELACLVVAGGDYPAMTPSAHGYGLTGQLWALTHLDRCIEAIHVDVDDFAHAWWGFVGLPANPKIVRWEVSWRCPDSESGMGINFAER